MPTCSSPVAATGSFGRASRARRRPLALFGILGAALGGALACVLFAPASRPAFDGDRAYEDLKKQVAFGPRVPNTATAAACRDWYLETLKPLADSVERQDFDRTIRGKRLAMTNVIARWKGAGGTAPDRGVILCAHWDTRPTSDYDPNARNRSKPLPGANDGASGVAVLLEIARSLKRQAPPVPVMIVLFDGEDFGPGIEDMFLGASYFAAHLPPDVPKRGILLDMIGDRDLRIPQEGHSVESCPEVVREVYGTARDLGLDRHFPNQVGNRIEDDHLPLIARGLKVIDLIDFDYGPGHSWWHTQADTPDKCSPISLKVVGDVVLGWVNRQGRK